MIYNKRTDAISKMDCSRITSTKSKFYVNRRTIAKARSRRFAKSKTRKASKKSEMNCNKRISTKCKISYKRTFAKIKITATVKQEQEQQQQQKDELQR